MRGAIVSLLAAMLAGCGARAHSSDDDDIGDWPDGDADSDSDADSDPGGEGEVLPGPREPDGVCTEAERNFDDDGGWAWHLDTGDFVEDCYVCATGCEGDIATFRTESGAGRDEPFHARVMISNCGPSPIAQPIHIQLVRPPDASGVEIVLGNGWTPADLPPWAAVWVDIEIDQEQCRGSDPEGGAPKHWRLDADSTVPECDEENNEPDLSGPGC